MNCNVIRDLLPLYVDGCCSQESTELITEHIAHCEACRRIYRQMCSSSASEQETPIKVLPHRVNDWKASLLQSVTLFVSFAIMTLGVILEGNTPLGNTNGFWAAMLIVPAVGFLLSSANWFFLRTYRSRKVFSVCSCLVTLTLTVLGYIWAGIHY